MTEDVELLRFIPRWFVMFNGPAELRHRVDIFTEPGFRHCMAFAYDAAGERWLIYDVTRIGTAVLALDRDTFDAWLTGQLASGSRVLQVDLPETVRTRNWLQTGMWCVTAVIHLVGARSGAWRPKALWRDLKRDGAIEVFTNGLESAA